MYATPNGDFLTFEAQGAERGDLEEREGVKGEPRGAGVPGHPHNELYRYDAADGSVMCVSCGEGVAPTKGAMLLPSHSEGLLETPASPRSPVSISEDGRRVFFQTSAQLVPQDTNEDTVAEEHTPVITGLGEGADTYEWEQANTEEASGVFCRVANGCTHLISAGENVGPEHFLGASANGENVFFSSAAPLLPEATREFTNIYDARVDGGFPPAAPRVECTSCQGAGSPPPQFNTPASEVFSGAVNPPVAVGTASTTSPSKPRAPTFAQRLAKALQACRKNRNRAKRRHCEAGARAKYARRHGK
jgi:hypothetical protein